MITPRRSTFVRIALLSLSVATLPLSVVHAQRALPHTRADLLLESGLWPQAEEAYYAQSSARPRDPVARAELGRYLAMRGAVVPGTILIEEALQFGLDSTLARRLLRPWEAVKMWRGLAGLGLHADSAIRARPPLDSLSLFRIPFPRWNRPNGDMGPLRNLGTVWVDVVPRMIGVDSMGIEPRRMGIEVLEAMVPSYDSLTHQVTLHADAKAALAASGERYKILRDTREVRVLMTSGRTLSLPAALAELAPSWWQLDLLHGWLVVKRP
jgi:hypothetical protein